jgi:predicted nucleotidyltransferase
MAKIIKQVMKNGFVVLNVNTNENCFASALNGAQPENSTVDQNNTSSRASSNRGSKSSVGSKILGEKEGIIPISLSELAIILNIDLDKINTIDLYGSKVYGTATKNSDWDVLIIGDIPNFVPGARRVRHNLDENTHLLTDVVTKNGDTVQAYLLPTEYFTDTNKFSTVFMLEVFSLPDNFKILNKMNYDTKINKENLINSTLSEVDYFWNYVRERFNEAGSDKYQLAKKIWHSFRYLIFTEQALKDDIITDFSAANYLYDGIVSNGIYEDYSYFEKNFLTLRMELEEKIKSYLLPKNDNPLPDTAIFQLVSQGTFSDTALGNKIIVVNNASGSTSGNTSTSGDSVVVNTVTLGDGKIVTLGDNVGGLNIGTALGDTALGGGIVLGDNVVISDGLALINGLGLGNGTVLGGDVILGDGIVISPDGIISVKSDTI